MLPVASIKTKARKHFKAAAIGIVALVGVIMTGQAIKGAFHNDPFHVAGKAIEQCEKRRESGELKTHVDSVLCSNPLMMQAFQSRGSHYTDLVQLIAYKRMEVAQQLDKGEISEAEAQNALDRYFDLVSEARHHPVPEPARISN